MLNYCLETEFEKTDLSFEELQGFQGRFKGRLKFEVISERSEENFAVDKSKFISKFGIILSWKYYSF